MNRLLVGRVDRLSSAKPDALPANIRRWLGETLTDDEQREADRLDALPLPSTSNMSKEVQEWLAQ